MVDELKARGMSIGCRSPNSLIPDGGWWLSFQQLMLATQQSFKQRSWTATTMQEYEAGARAGAGEEHEHEAGCMVIWGELSERRSLC